MWIDQLPGPRGQLSAEVYVKEEVGLCQGEGGSSIVPFANLASFTLGNQPWRSVPHNVSFAKCNPSPLRGQPRGDEQV